MLAFHNDTTIKDNLLAQLQAHYDADEIIKGKYWEGGKGCAVGCTIHSSNYSEYESRYGIPEMLARLKGTIFEGLPNEKAKKWPLRFSNAITPGTDLSRVGYQFMYWNLTENLVLGDSDNVEVQKAIIQCREAIKQCAEAIYPLIKGLPFYRNAAASAAVSAMSASISAEGSAAISAMNASISAQWSMMRSTMSAARSAEWSAAASAAESAARSAASAARSAASAARSAESAERSAESAERSAESAERSAAYEKMADKIIELLEAA